MKICHKERVVPILTPALQREMAQNINLLLKSVHRYKNYGLSFDDLISAGKIGLMNGLLIYDGQEDGKTKRSLLSQYVHNHIQNEIQY